MKITVRGSIRSSPPLPSTDQKTLVEEALRQVGARVQAVSKGKVDLGAELLGHVEIQMPVALDRIQNGYYTPKAAASFLANRIFKQLLPHLPAESRNEDVLRRAVAYGSEEGYEYKGGPQITADYLRQNGFEPRWRAEIEGVRYHISQPFQAAGRVAYIAYVEEEGQVHVRVYYASQSQGIWRAASHRQTGLRHIGIGEGWIGKGNPHEESTDLPFELISELSRRQTTVRTDLSEEQGDLIFYGALEVKSREDYAAGNSHPTEGFFPAEARAIGSFSQHIQQGERSWGSPETFSFGESGDAPDFSRVVSTEQIQSPMYGAITAYIFASHNGRLNYLIYREGGGKAWVASVQDVTSGVTSRGARRQIVDALNITMPLNEYRDQIPHDYRGEQKDRSYWDAWEYIKRLPFMTDLYQNMNWEMPGGQGAPPPHPRRSRNFAQGDYVRIPRTGGKISWGQILSLQGTQAVVSVPTPDGKTGTKPADLTRLMPCYRENELVNVPGLSAQALPGRVVSVDWGQDVVTCAAEVPGQGERQVTVPARDLDHVN
ncbi:MAG: hypothetical protein JKY65_09750 [Planctomycetes bacterium]|nr:hypothetical protein [Planctomycetota bacterium]